MSFTPIQIIIDSQYKVVLWCANVSLQDNNLWMLTMLGYNRLFIQTILISDTKESCIFVGSVVRVNNEQTS